MGIAIAVVGLFVLAALVLVGGYNGLVGKRNRFKNAYAQIDVQLKRRYDLIPNLVETVKGYMKHESETLEAVIRARNAAYGAAQAAAAQPGDPSALKSLATAESALAQGLSKIIALSENYPDLKASANMSQLTEELTSTENRVAFARQAYNDSVTEYNSAREVFPAVLFAGAMGFGSAGLLEAIEAPEERRAPKVSFS
ncbi:MAG TPA: LemA family protein [Polyangiales bacterium]|nr:LemA family protein [Polyangiales bacterium]